MQMMQFCLQKMKTGEKGLEGVGGVVQGVGGGS